MIEGQCDQTGPRRPWGLLSGPCAQTFASHRLRPLAKAEQWPCTACRRVSFSISSSSCSFHLAFMEKFMEKSLRTSPITLPWQDELQGMSLPFRCLSRCSSECSVEPCRCTTCHSPLASFRSPARFCNSPSKGEVPQSRPEQTRVSVH